MLEHFPTLIGFSFLSYVCTMPLTLNLISFQAIFSQPFCCFPGKMYIFFQSEKHSQGADFCIIGDLDAGC